MLLFVLAGFLLSFLFLLKPSLPKNNLLAALLPFHVPRLIDLITARTISEDGEGKGWDDKKERL